MTQILELSQFAQHDGVPQVDIGGCRIDSELDPQRPPLGSRLHELAQQHLRRQRVHAPEQQLSIFLENVRRDPRHIRGDRGGSHDAFHRAPPGREHTMVTSPLV